MRPCSPYATMHINVLRLNSREKTNNFATAHTAAVIIANDCFCCDFSIYYYFYSVNIFYTNAFIKYLKKEKGLNLSPFLLISFNYFFFAS